ncbi:leucyl/phenylalanyl-tRNA--protein transferase [gamma proteobacterium NOR5-3]|nr:leucyl/phenylalanyl-tRNA--protein transferase [gamma proteobacterium NOR5-3]
MQEALTTMLRMQDRMNTRVHPEWISQHFAWHRAIWVECAELVDHHGYKWWKHQTPDLEQVQLEVIDIWHFGMSAYFREGIAVEQLAQEIMALWPSNPPELGVLEAAEAVAAVAAGEARFCVAAFASLLSAAALDFPGLYRQYLGKNVLNFFRQDHGYKEGSYRKLWDGREDNEHLMELLMDIDTSDADAENQLYQSLAARYAATA